MQLEKLSAFELGAKVNDREISAVEVIKYFIERIDKRNPSINAFTYTKVEDAISEAKRIDEKVKSEGSAGLFAGVPVALKDFLPSKKGWLNSHGGVKSLVRVDDADSMFYTAARQLGAIAIGKTNAPAFGFSGCCSNEMYGATSNPFNVNYTSGGSSGGSAAAVADGLVLLAEGGDAGGSIRIPAGWCNLFGMKPSLGTVPSYCRPDAWAATHPYCFNGALTKTVLDSAIMLSAMAQYNPLDPISLPINSNKDFVALMTQNLKGKRIAFTYDFDLYPVDSEVASIVYQTARRFAELGATVEPVSFSWKHSLEEMMGCWCMSISVDTALDLHQWKLEGLDLIKDHPEELPPEFIKWNRRASQYDIYDFRKFNEIRTDILDNFESKLSEYDVIVSPTAICPPLHHLANGRVDIVAGRKLDPATSFISFAETPLVNFVGHPAASVPAGITQTGLPVGMQIIGRQYHDEDVLAFSHAIERIQPWNYDIPFNRDI